ncbi:1216_t:CDS:1 [Funneliformis caledonium]|uniref:1216_t:CDS:1 n=1 Tax=Funneliformis caledonium TaxID=1117310 RepID=A0A9N9AI95_9GLOM|nr:1216_t:CDS:1 [Funneliformis caledonium]
MTNKRSIRCHQRVDNAEAAAASSPLPSSSSSPTIAEKLSLAKRLDELKTSVKDQEHLLKKEKESPFVKKFLEKIINEYSDIKTTLMIPELLAPAIKTRAQGTPRPQNAYILFRKDVSKGIYLLNRDCMSREARTVTYSSKIAGFLWGVIKSSRHEHDFWTTLYQIACLKHSETYQNYVYRPIRKKRNNSSSSQATENRQSPTVATIETTTSSNHPPTSLIITPDFNDVPSFNCNFVDQHQASYMPDLGMFINQQMYAQPQYPVIYQPSGIMMQQDTTTAQFELVSAAPQFVETTVWHSTTYAVSYQQTSSQYYQQFANPSFLPAQQIVPSHEDLVFLSQLGIDPFLLNFNPQQSFDM